MTDTASPANRLADATSPYLQQHARNPVDWWPWCEEALALARREGRPILLSIGYSACHWCHVMAHESFEDEETAALMNRLFVNIKVDREERPDLDRIYQTAHQLLAQRPGGWPLTVFVTPDDQTPFFAGTYFPKTPRHGLPSFTQLLQHIDEAWNEQREAIVEQNAALHAALRDLQPTGDVAQRIDAGPLEVARQQLARNFDAAHGGFGRAPKFPHPAQLGRLLRHWAATAVAGQPDQRALDMATLTLERMATGGLFDQLGGGFCRYSVDDEWGIPHFEKMLYDNGPLLALYTDAWRITGSRLFAEVCEATAGWVLREMQSSEGGYYSSLDADSEGEEGRFYVWSREEVAALLDAPTYRAFAQRYGLDGPPNFEGRWHLHVRADLATIADHTGTDPADVAARLAVAREILFAARERRVRPGRDDKVLTSWNALMIEGMARTGLALGRADWLESAERALDFVRRELWRDGRLLASWKDGRANLPAYLDDHAFLINALLALLQARWRKDDLDFAVALADLLLARFADPQNGGFFFTADDHERLIQRPKPYGDESLPAGNGVAAIALGRLGHLLGEPRYLDAAERTLRNAWPQLSGLPYAHATLLDALDEQLEPPEIVVLRGASSDLREWLERATARYAPRRLSLAVPSDADSLPADLAERRAPPGGCLAYVCRGTHCEAPVGALSELDGRLAAGEATAR
jgi:uncharacterized protein YyaL (SSP411 family)